MLFSSALRHVSVTLFITREMHRGLAGRVRPADDEHARARELPGLRRRRPVEDADAVEVGQRGDVQSAIRDAHPEDDRARGPRTTRDRDGELFALRVEPIHLAGEEKRGSEDPRLLVRALRQLGTAQAAREAEVVADPCARASLSADRVALTTSASRPSDEAYTAAARPAGPAPTITTSNGPE